MERSNLAVELVKLVSHTDKRAVAFLRGHPNLDAATEFDKVADKKLGKRLRHSMQLWISFQPDTSGKFHRFKSSSDKYRDCFVFEDISEAVRLYGSACHPTPKTNPHFELVILTTHAIKKKDHTDTANLDRVLAWMNDERTKAAIKQAYPDEPKSKERKKS